MASTTWIIKLVAVLLVSTYVCSSPLSYSYSYGSSTGGGTAKACCTVNGVSQCYETGTDGFVKCGGQPSNGGGSGSGYSGDNGSGGGTGSGGYGSGGYGSGGYGNGFGSGGFGGGGYGSGGSGSYGSGGSNTEEIGYEISGMPAWLREKLRQPSY